MKVEVDLCGQKFVTGTVEGTRRVRVWMQMEVDTGSVQDSMGLARILSTVMTEKQFRELIQPVMEGTDDHKG